MKPVQGKLHSSEASAGEAAQRCKTPADWWPAGQPGQWTVFTDPCIEETWTKGLVWPSDYILYLIFLGLSFEAYDLPFNMKQVKMEIQLKLMGFSN